MCGFTAGECDRLQCVTVIFAAHLTQSPSFSSPTFQRNLYFPQHLPPFTGSLPFLHFLSLKENIHLIATAFFIYIYLILCTSLHLFYSFNFVKE